MSDAADNLAQNRPSGLEYEAMSVASVPALAAQWVDERTVVGSIRSLVEYDCSQPRARTLSLEAYSEQMGEGRLVASEQKPDADWSGVAPGGIGENTRKLICSK